VADVADPVAAVSGVASLPVPVEASERVAAYTTPFHSVTGAIMRRSMRLADFFEDNPQSIDALLDFLAGVHAFMKISGASGREIDLDVTSKVVPAGGGMKVITYLRNRNDEEYFEGEDASGLMNDGAAAQIVTTLRHK
jgi:hypothetical protein